MKFKKQLSIVLAGLLITVQLPLAALADTAPTDQTTTNQNQTQPSTDQTATPVPAPAPAPATDPAPSTSAPTTSTQPTNQTQTTAPTTGPTKPTGPDANQYTYNPATGMWESAQYIWNPQTNQTTPKSDPGYYYNPATGTWDTTKYVYHPESGTYQPVVVASPVNPAVPTAAAASSAAGSNCGCLLDALAQLFGGGNFSNGQTGPNSTNSIVSNNNNNGFFDMFTKAAITNNLNSSAITGNAGVSGNTQAGSATTGPATVVANLFNLLNSAWSWASGGLTTFVKNLFGNQTGDIMLQPTVTTTGGGGNLGSLAASNSGTGPNSTNTINANNNNNLTVNSQASGVINNNVNALAQSGNANVSGNTQGGNATSGAAAADVNIMNLINSAIGAGQSFFGVLNVFGNLNGDILFPQGFLNSIAAASNGTAPSSSASNSQTGPNSLNQINGTTNNNVNLNSTNQSAINNNLNSAARSGAADVSGNTQAGSATTGSASTNSDVFNFAGNLVGDNAVLVLVNVLGHWVGAIMNLPGTGTSQAALLGGNASVSNSNTGPNSVNTVNSTTNNNLNLNQQNQSGINNNINAGAISGNASVNHNTIGGNATSGNASVATNIANFVGSTINVKHWFGVLMINVFGDWFGSVNQDTAAGNTSTASGTNQPANQPAQTSTTHHSSHQIVTNTTNHSGQNQSAQTSGQNSGASQTNVHVLGARDVAVAAHKSHEASLVVLIAAGLMLMAGMLLGLERKLSR